MKALESMLGKGYEISPYDRRDNSGSVLHGICIRRTGEDVAPVLYLEEIILYCISEKVPREHLPGAEIPYVFYNVNGASEEETLAGQISQAWINFARSGIPSAEGLPEWVPYTREEGAAMLLDTESKLVNHHDRELMSLLAPDYVY